MNLYISQHPTKISHITYHAPKDIFTHLVDPSPDETD